MILRTDTTFPSRRAYVLKLRSEARPDALSGRLENLVTGRPCEFASARELIDLIVGDIQQSERFNDD